jgi:hypothetical protein
MRTFGPLLRVTVLCGLVVVLWIKPGVRAQYGGYCYSFSSDDNCCPSCCSAHNCLEQAYFIDGDGYDTLQDMFLYCGTNPETCFGEECGDTEVPVAVDNGECDCLGVGNGPCVSDDDCCLGEICNNGTCED